MRRDDELSPAIVAAIVALLAALDDQDEQPLDERIWKRSGAVLPSWSSHVRRAWRDLDRERGWPG